MSPLPRLVLALSCAIASPLATRAESLLPPTLLSLNSLAEFKSPAANWQIAGGIGGDPRREKIIAALPGAGVLINSPTNAAKAALVTAWEHGDLELDLDFLLPPGANSGLYLMGRYELRLADSWGVKAPTSADCGGIAQRRDEKRPQGQEGFEGTAPSANASRAPGLWQHLHVEFQAPRFDASGKKTTNARFLKVMLNDFVIHENVEVTGPTQGATFTEEKPLGPLLVPGDRGALALRDFRFKRFEPDSRVEIENLTYKYYFGEPKQIGEYDGKTPTREGVPPSFAAETIDRTGKFAVVFEGAFVAPRDGDYAFTVEVIEPTRLVVGGQTAVSPLEQGGLTHVIALKKGRHPFRLDYLHASWRPPGLRLMAEGPGIALHHLTTVRARRAGNAQQLLVQPDDRVRLQRSFIPYEPKKRLYAINVGTPTGVHYAYDFETGAILRVWRGSFLDAFEMWDGRGEPQLAKPAGPAITLNAKPTIALLERATNEWPDAPEQLWSSQGYTLDPTGQPTFLGKLASLSVSDRIAPTPDGRGLTRTINLKGGNTEWQTWVLLAEAKTITPQVNGSGFVIGDRDYYIDLPADSAVQPFVRTHGDHQQLVLPVTSAGLTKPIVYSLVW